MIYVYFKNITKTTKLFYSAQREFSMVLQAERMFTFLQGNLLVLALFAAQDFFVSGHMFEPGSCPLCPGSQCFGPAHPGATIQNANGIQVLISRENFNSFAKIILIMV